MDVRKSDFLRNELIAILKNISSDTQPLWGKMTLQQMVEHFTDSVKIASSKTSFTEIVSPQENLLKMREFLMSEKPFRENTANPLLSELPPPVRNTTISEAIAELENEIKFFFSVFDNDPHLTTLNPFFGDLNYSENIHLLYKHALHHLRQFGVKIEDRNLT